LATLTMMSEGKVSECRSYWMKQGLLEGHRVAGQSESSAVWRLTIPNIWDKNIRWAEKYATISERLAYKDRLKKAVSPPLASRICPRCNQEFSPSGRRSRRCPECQLNSTREQALIRATFGTGAVKRFIKKGDACSECGRKERLELHLLDADQEKQHQVRIL